MHLPEHSCNDARHECAGAGTSTPDDEREKPAPRLKRLKLNKFRNVRPTELVFDDEWNVLLGKNSTGKTTLLELIAATIRGDASAFEGVELDVEADQTFGLVQVKWSLKSAEMPNVEQFGTGLPAPIMQSAQRRFRADTSREGIDNVTVVGDERGVDGMGNVRFGSMAGGHAPWARVIMSAGANIQSKAILRNALPTAMATGDVERFDDVLTFFHRIGPTGDMVLSNPPVDWVLTSPEVVDAF